MITKEKKYKNGEELYLSANELLRELGYGETPESIILNNNEIYISEEIGIFPEVYRIAIRQRKDGKVCMIIDFAVNGEEERYIRALVERVGEERENAVEYALMITSQKILLLNSHVEISSLTGEKWKKNRIVLEVGHWDQKRERFLKFFSYQSIFKTRNTDYFKDIVNYRNIGFQGRKGSWPLYESTLNNFFLYYSEEKSSYQEHIYDWITADDYIDFIRDVSMASSRALKSPQTLCNKYSYLKGFILFQSPDNKDFQKARREIEEAICSLESKKEKEGLDDTHLQVIDSYFRSHKNSVRNCCIYYLLLYYGMERKKLASLKWTDFDLEKGELLAGECARPLPEMLTGLLKQLKQENEEGGVQREYLFYRHNGQGAERLKDSSINEIFRRIGENGRTDTEIKQYSPQYIRKGLVRYLLVEKNCRLEEIMFWLDIDVENLKSYISNEELRQIVADRNSKHPFET